MINIYVGNLAFKLSEEALKELFVPYGSVEKVKIIKDTTTGKSKGFGFVEMSDEKRAKTAIQELNGKEVQGRALKVNQARPKRERGGYHGRSHPAPGRMKQQRQWQDRPF